MWQKQGLVYISKNKWGWDYSHATHPVVDFFSYKDKWRIYFSTRDKNNFSQISFIDVEIENPKKIYYEHPKPILDLGLLGEFDEFGIMPTSIIKFKDKIFLYYIGFSVKKSVPFETFIGLAVSDDGVNFKKIGGPILGKDFLDPYFSGTMCAFFDQDIIRGYYMSGLGWEHFDGRVEPKYHIKYAESEDGIHWKKNNLISIKLKNKEAGICQAAIVKDSVYRMWYCYRNMGKYRTLLKDAYCIGYAESYNGVDWERKDDSNFSLMPSQDDDWAKTMTCYPWVFNYNGKKWIFYNGDSFGLTGFGCATQNSSLITGQT